MQEASVNDVGILLVVTVKDRFTGAAVNVASATTKQMIIKKPDGTTVTKTASLYSSGADGKIKYVTVDGDLAQAGVYEYAGYLEIGGVDFHTRPQKFRVSPNLS